MLAASASFPRSALLHALLNRGLLATATATSDPLACVKVAGLQIADPADAIACQKSFPFNETLRQNVFSVVSRVFDFYTFEDFYLNSPSPFQESNHKYTYRHRTEQFNALCREHVILSWYRIY